MLEVTAQIPGKIMLAGEYAVLYGGDALAFTVDRFMQVRASSHPDRFSVMSNLWQEPVVFLREEPPGHLVDDPLIETVLAAARLFDIGGAVIDVRSQLSTNFGIGSSSALRLGVLLAMQGLSGDEAYFADLPEESHWAMARLAFDLQKRHQKAASGYDIATQLVGGLVKFSPSDLAEQSLDQHGTKPLHCPADRLNGFVEFWVGGAGSPTKTVVKDTVGFLERNAMVQRVMDNSHLLVNQFLNICREGTSAHELEKLITLCVEQRAIFAGSPHFPSRIFEQMARLEGFDRSFTVKTTGAGGEDALMLLGDRSAIESARNLFTTMGWQQLDARYTPSGVKLSMQHTTEGEPVIA